MDDTRGMERLGEVIICPYCPHAGPVLEKVTNNYNPGDSLIHSHVHINLFYRCGTCGRTFLVRGHVALENLYYGSLENGRPFDTGPETQAAIRAALDTARPDLVPPHVVIEKNEMGESVQREKTIAEHWGEVRRPALSES